MRNTDYFRRKKVIIIGLARSGVACANLLFDLGADVRVTEKADNPAVRSFLKELKSEKIRVELGGHSRAFIEGREMAVISPGVPSEAEPVAWARELGMPVASEIEVGALLCPAPIIAITGTCGKTTVTTLIGKILEKDKRRVFTCGNIGRPFCREVARIQEGDFVSLEVSSFQLETIGAFKPKIALILNLSRNHLDRYNSMEDYLAAKARIFKNQDKGDYLILNQNDPWLKGLAGQAKARVAYFSREEGFNPNQSAVLAVAKILGIDRSLALEAFREFKGVEHRLEQVARINGINFVNDSKATTVDATIWALQNTGNPVVLIAGGREKGNDYSLILDLVRSKVKTALLIGEAKDRIKNALGGATAIEEASSLEEAVAAAFEKAKPGDCVLFSPMCKSFDMFSDYEHRGRVFKEAVNKLI